MQQRGRGASRSWENSIGFQGPTIPKKGERIPNVDTMAHILSAIRVQPLKKRFYRPLPPVKDACVRLGRAAFGRLIGLLPAASLQILDFSLALAGQFAADILRKLDVNKSITKLYHV